MKLLQLTDIHLSRPGALIAGRDPNASFARAIAHATEFHSDAEALFITGDLSDWGDAEDYVRLREGLRRVDIPVHLLIGNHDDRDAFLSQFPELEGAGGFVHHVVPLTLGHAVTLDTWGPESHAGHFCEARAAWLSDRLRELPGPVWLFMHHNPVPTGVAAMDRIMLLDAARFAAVVGPHRDRIAHVLHGHCHIQLSASLCGIPVSATRSTNHQGWPEFTGSAFLAGADLASAYAVILAGRERSMVHMIEFDYAGPLRNGGSTDYADWDRTSMVR